jgi:hypothetical protein
MVPTFGGSAVFGVANKVIHQPSPNEIQIDSFAGINGIVQLVMGSRGRRFHVSGVLIDADPASVSADEAILLSFADGIARTFTDTYGNVFQNVVFNLDDYQRSPEGIRPVLNGWCLPFSLVLVGLS